MARADRRATRFPHQQTSLCRSVALLFFGIFVLPDRAAGETTQEFWPELDAFYYLGSKFRVLSVTSWSKQRDVPYNNAEEGIHLDIFVHRFKPLLFRPLSRQDDSRMQRIMIRVGYRYNHSLNTTPSTSEHRPHVDATLRWAFPANLLMSDRHRVEFRFMSGTYSWRYRNELKVERDFQIRRLPFTTYLSAEPFYDSRSGRGWSQFRFTGGIVYPFQRIWELETYFAHQIVTTSGSPDSNAIGLTLTVYLHKH